jgi:hypothetical protein
MKHDNKKKALWLILLACSSASVFTSIVAAQENQDIFNAIKDGIRFSEPQIIEEILNFSETGNNSVEVLKAIDNGFEFGLDTGVPGSSRVIKYIKCSKYQICEEINISKDLVAYEPNITFSINEFMGACDEKGLNNLDFGAIGECVGNALNPRIPNPLMIFDPITGANARNKWAALDFLPRNAQGELDIAQFDIGKTANVLINSPALVLFTFIEIAFAALKFVIIFMARFLFTYLFYVSIGYQALMGALQSDANLENKQRIQASFAIMGIATIMTLAYGGGLIQWS